LHKKPYLVVYNEPRLKMTFT